MRKLIRRVLCPLLLFISSNVFSQGNAVSGVVIGDDDNAPLKDVTVTLKGTNIATKTNQVGYYSITAQKGQILVFTFVDYVRQEQVVGSSNTINVRLVLSQKQLSEVVVTAYGAQRNKRELAYQAQNIKGDEIAQTQKDNWINALAGRVAGANITPTSGTPGASTSIVLRGAVSLGNSNQPLFIVDGVPIDNQTLNQENLISASNASAVSFANRNSDYGNRAADINSEDIESITILKGPEASALYGSDGASGAIVITTKKGKIGKATVSYDNSFRMEKVYLFPEIQQVYGRGANGIADPNATVNPFSAGAVYGFFGPKYPANTKLYDNVKSFFQTGFTQKHNLNVEGGSDVSTYRLSVNYLDQSGVVPKTGFERLTIRLGGSAKISPKLNINTSFAYANSTTDKASKGAGGYLLNLLNYPSDLDVRDYINPDGTRKLYRSSSTSVSAEFDNPFWDVNKNPSQDKLDRITGNFTVNFNPLKWLNLAAIVGLDFYGQTGFLVTHPQSRLGYATNGFYSQYEQNTKNLNNIFRATVKKTFGKFSNTFTAGLSVDDNKTKIESQRGERFYEADFISINNTDPLSRDAKTTFLNDRKVRFFGNYVLGYNNLAYLSLAGSREGTSKLVSRKIDKDPYYNFGSASLSFVFTDIKAVQKLDWLNYGKARISYGTTGKGPSLQYIIDNTFVSQITTGGGYAYGVTGNNYDLKPEYTENLEFGGELRFLHNRLSIDVTSYKLKSRDQIIPARISYGTGFVLKWLNGGIVENKGIEAVVNYSILKKKNLTWDITANFDRNRGKVIALPSGLPTYYDSDTWVFGNLRSQAYTGAAIGNLAGFSLAKNANGDILINPSSGLPISNGDFTTVGDRQPDFRVGLINTLTYKDFSLSFNLDFRKGGDVFNGNEYFLFLTGLSKKSLDRERPVTITGVLNDGLQNTSNPTKSTITVYPYYRSDFYGTSVATEADFIESVNWMRLRDATLTYRLPQSLLKRQKVVRSASVFVTGTDLFIITNYTGADPSVNTNNASNRGVGGAGIDYGSLSTPRGLNAGIKVQF
ncbi:SusC/RagA family TonB-linked outer membrane protein [Ferruginibacter profundus]